MKKILSIALGIFSSIVLISCENVHTTKVFILPIEPNMFNWTIHSGDSFDYQASLVNAPDLPKWIEYLYSKRHHTGFLYGVPPKEQQDIEIEVVGLNRRTYETRRRVLHLNVEPKPTLATHHVYMKIDNLNVEDFFDNYKISRLLDIFKFKLWKESFSDLYVTFLTSAVTLGARLPLRPNEGEGVVIRLGSVSEFSNTLIELQDEVRPLSKLQYCPRDFKRTTVERLFREEGFILDWCNFKLVDETAQANEKLLDYTNEASMLPELDKEPIWTRPTKAEVSQRSYAGEFAFTILIPILIMIISVVLLTLILGFQREGVSKQKGQNTEVQMSQYATDSLLRGATRDITPEINGTTRSHTTSPQATVRLTATNGISRPTPPPYTGTMRTAVVDF